MQIIIVNSLTLTYGTAVHHKKIYLAESLMEDFNFSSAENIRNALKIFAGIKGARPSEIERALNDYQKICEMRHCCVHRFGKLGSKNAIKLGIETHNEIFKSLFFYHHIVKFSLEAQPVTGSPCDSIDKLQVTDTHLIAAVSIHFKQHTLATVLHTITAGESS